MALLDHGRYRPPTDDYRTYLINQNQPPIAWENDGAHFKRAGARARAIFGAPARWGRALYRTIRSAKCRRLQRELMWHGIPYSYLLEDKDDAVLPRPACRESAGQVRIPVTLDERWD